MHKALRISLQLIGWIAVAFFLIGGLGSLGSDAGAAVAGIVIAVVIAAALMYQTVRRRRRPDLKAARPAGDRTPPTVRATLADTAVQPAPQAPSTPDCTQEQQPKTPRSGPQAPAPAAAPAAATTPKAPAAAPVAPAKPSRQEKKARVHAIEATLAAAANGDTRAADRIGPAIEELRTLKRQWRVESILSATFAAAVREATSDDIVTADEETWLAELAARLGLDSARELNRNKALREEFLIACINDDRPPALAAPQMILKPGETAHGEFRVSLMKQVTQREWRGTSSGVSIPIGRTGIRYRTGATRGRSVVVGTQLVADDTGILTITSARAVFAGTKKTLEFRNDRLVSVEQYTDGLRLGVTNRQAASLFKFSDGSPSIAAALISCGTRH
jgi:hypothetical protein